MNVISRFTDIVNANVNALLDKAEDPEKMLTLIAREMEETLVEVRATTARHIAEKKEIKKKIQWLNEEADCWEEKAQLAVRRDRDDLAKMALKERSENQQAAIKLAADADIIEQNLCKLQTDTQLLQEKLDEVRLRQESLIVRSKTASSRLAIKRQLHDTDINSALARFGEFEQRIDQIDGEIESFELGQKSLTDEINALDLDDTFTEELNALKAKMHDPVV